MNFGVEMEAFAEQFARDIRSSIERDGVSTQYNLTTVNLHASLTYRTCCKIGRDIRTIRVVDKDGSHFITKEQLRLLLDRIGQLLGMEQPARFTPFLEPDATSAEMIRSLFKGVSKLPSSRQPSED